MLPALAIFLGLLLLAMVSVTAAYRVSGSEAWSREFDSHKFGLATELTYLVLSVFAGLSISLIMPEAFGFLFLDGGVRNPLFWGPAIFIVGGVSTYMFVLAPGSLAKRQGVSAESFRRECRRPYAMYAPFALVSWGGLVVPIVAMILVSIGGDSQSLALARSSVIEQGTSLEQLAGQAPEQAAERHEVFRLTYQEGVDLTQRTVSRYIWVVAVFVLFVIVILNTKITSVFAQESQDAFKWLMWGLLLLAISICAFGVYRYQDLRQIALGTNDALASLGLAENSMPLYSAAKTAHLSLKNEDAVYFLKSTLERGSMWLLFFGYGFQIILAKITHRSVIRVIFPSKIAGFVEAFMVPAEEGK